MFESFVSDNATATYADYEKLLNEKLKCAPEAVVVIHNAGSLGELFKTHWFYLIYTFLAT